MKQDDRRHLGKLRLPELGLGPGLGMPAGARTFHPAILFANGEQGVWFDPSDRATMWADTEATTPASINGAVARIDDKSGNGHHAIQTTAASRPILRAESGGRYYLEFDGVDDVLVTGDVDLTGSHRLTVWTANRKSDPGGITDGIMETGTDGVGVDDGTILISVPNNGSPDRYAFFLRGTATTGFTTGAEYSAPETAVLSCHFDIGGGSRSDEIFPRVNGVTPSTLIGSGSASAGAGNFANAPLKIGRRAGYLAPEYFNGRLYGLILCNTLVDSELVVAVEYHLAQKSGIIL